MIVIRKNYSNCIRDLKYVVYVCDKLKFATSLNEQFFCIILSLYPFIRVSFLCHEQIKRINSDCKIMQIFRLWFMCDRCTHTIVWLKRYCAMKGNMSTSGRLSYFWGIRWELSSMLFFLHIPATFMCHFKITSSN